MRSILIIAGLLVGVTLLLVNGYLPRTAGAAAPPAGAGAGHGGHLELKYADFEEEQGLLATKTSRAHQPDAEPAALPPVPEPRPQPQEPRAPSAEPRPAEPSQPPGGEVRPHSSDSSAPVANAGHARTVWAGRNELPLDGSKSTGDGLRYSWQQVAGPAALTVASPDQAKTVATGLTAAAGDSWDDARYEFELTVTDVEGRQSTDVVRCTVRVAPQLSIRPRAKRELALRDGYLLAHYDAWKTNATDATETFELRSPGELFIQHMGGRGSFDISGGDTGDGYAYQISVYYQEGQASTWLEFFVDTAERVPAVVQIGVSWE